MNMSKEKFAVCRKYSRWRFAVYLREDANIWIVSDFENQFKSSYPTPTNLRDVWTRIAASTDDTMSKNLALSVIYMLHVERYLDKAPSGKDCITETRRKSLERFDDWVRCACEWRCGRSWNFANDIGLSVGGSPNNGCPVARWIQIKPYSRRLFGARELSLEEKNCQWDWKRTVDGGQVVISYPVTVLRRFPPSLFFLSNGTFMTSDYMLSDYQTTELETFFHYS